MIPSRRLIILVLAWSLLGFVASQVESLGLTWQIAGMALLLWAAIDAWVSRKSPLLTVERQVAGVWPVDVWNRATVVLHNEGQRKLSIEVIDDYPSGWQMEGLPYFTTIAEGSHAAVSYHLCPHSRGDAAFGGAHVRIASPAGMWRRTHRIGPASKVKVFPDFSKLFGHALRATDRRSPAAGTIRKRRRGEGTDFRQLREYRQGDSLRAIDWKATARQQKPISREYQEERDQQVVFLLDTGRRMLAKDDTGTHFDHALNALITLAFLAQKQGDAVGVMTFGGVTRWLSPQKGRLGLDRLMSGLYDVQASEIAPDYELAASALRSKLSKRAFVVLITNLRDEDDTAIRTACELLSMKHLVMCASLREKSMDAAMEAPVHQFADALQFSASAHYMSQRNEAIKRLGIRAEHLIDITPEKLTLALVKRYADIKESGQL